MSVVQVIHVQVLKFKSAFKEAKSLDEMIKHHNDQYVSLGSYYLHATH